MAPLKMIHLNFIENTSAGNSGSPGQWKDPRDRSYTKDRIQYYMDLAKLAEKGKITSIFLTDAYGISETYEKSAAVAFQGSWHVPHMDPLLFAVPMTSVTKSLGVVVTGTTSYLPPYIVARNFSTVDHLTEGRIGWNVVTSFNAASGQAMGLDKMIPHDERYERAHEFLDILYDLWEGSWEDGAAVWDVQRDMAYDASKIHKVEHQGRFYKMSGYNQVHPSPQRTPVIFQAGASKSGIGFSGKHAEAVFVHGTAMSQVRKQVDAIRAEATRVGRDGSQIQFFMAFFPTLGRTHEEAVAKWEKARSYAHAISGLATIADFTGVDLSVYPLDEPFEFEGKKSDAAIYGWIDAIKAAAGRESGTKMTPRELGAMIAMGPTSSSPVGTAEEVADVMEKWIEEANVDGFNLQQYITTESFTDVVELLIPELQKRGIYHTEYPVPGGTLRENLYRKKGQNLVPDDHPAHPYKWNVRETNHKSAWDLRENGAELAAAAAAADDRADEQEANTNGSHAVNGTSFVIGNGVKEAP